MVIICVILTIMLKRTKFGRYVYALGGTSMAGGIGNVVGTIIGGVLSSVISTCITLLRVSSYWETIVTGAVVLIAVLIDAVKDNPVIKAKIKRIFSRKA